MTYAIIRFWSVGCWIAASASLFAPSVSLGVGHLEEGSTQETSAQHDAADDIAIQALTQEQLRRRVDELVADLLHQAQTDEHATLRSARAVQALLRARGPLADGATSGMVDLLTRSHAEGFDETPTRRLVRNQLIGNMFRIVVTADGLERSEARLASLSGATADGYAGGLTLLMASGLGGSETTKERFGVDCSNAEARELLEFLLQREVKRCATSDGGSMPRSLEDPAMILPVVLTTLIAADSGVSADARLAAGVAFMQILDAQDAMSERLKVPSLRRFYQWKGGTYEVWEILLRSLCFGNERPFSFSLIAHEINRLAEVGDDALTPEYVALIVQVLDWLPRELAQAGPVLQSLPEICVAVAKLTTRIASIPETHRAWTAQNRCVWIAAVDRDRSKYAEMSCEEIRNAWASAKATLPPAWREECAKRETEKAAEKAVGETAPRVPATPQ